MEESASLWRAQSLFVSAIYSSTFTFFSEVSLTVLDQLLFLLQDWLSTPCCIHHCLISSHFLECPMLFLCIGGSGINRRVDKVPRAPTGPWESSLHSALLLSLTHQRFVRLSNLKSCFESMEQYLSLILRKVLVLHWEMWLWVPEKLWRAMEGASTWLLLGYFQ